MSDNVRKTRGDEAGLTLIELLVSITILGILMAAVSAAMMVGLSTNKSTGARLDESRDEQFIAAYFSGDAQGATTIVPGGAGAPKCNFAGGGGRSVVDFVGQDLTSATEPRVTARTVSYVTRAAADGRLELHRLVCTGAAVTPAPGGDTTLARHLSADPRPRAVCADPCKLVVLALKSGDLDYTLTGHRRTA